ncbi:MAG TPA: DUF4810 domain-containing protein [Burkholderiaceae bacterium]
MKAASALRRCALGICVALLAGCAHKAAPPLYMWETFPKMQYDTLQRPGAAPLEQVSAMEAQAEKARATGAALPPGFRAHLGMLKLSAGDADRARELWQAEKVAFPESAPYMDQLLKRLDAPAKKGNPA